MAAFNRLLFTLPLTVVLLRNKFKAMCRIAAKFSGADPFLILLSSSKERYIQYPMY